MKEKHLEEKVSHTTIDLPFATHYVVNEPNVEILFYPHWHREFELFLVMEGTLELTIEKRTYELSEGDCAFIAPSFSHGAKNTKNAPCHFYAFDFSDTLLDENKNSRFFRKYINPVLDGSIALPEFLHKDQDWCQTIIHCLTEIYEKETQDLSTKELFIKSKIYTIWEQLFQHALYKEKYYPSMQRDRERLLPALEYMEKNYSYEISLEDLAKTVNLSEGRFCRLFKETMGSTPFQYLLRFRIMQSCTLLTESNRRIGDIAALSGFNNISYYNKIFLKFIGCTPKHYRNHTV